MSDTALTRTARALDLVPFIVENPGVSIEELAAEFDSSPKQILADLNMVFMCGLPSYSTLEMIDIHFDDDYVTVADPQVLDKPRTLTKPEAVSLSIALETLAQLRGEGDRLTEDIRILQEKLNRAIKTLNSESHSIMVGEIAKPDHLPEIERAIKDSLTLRIEYISAHSDSRSLRIIAPQKIRYFSAHFYLDAWEYDSATVKTFRVDRILGFEIVAAPGPKESGVSIEEPLHRVELLIKRKAQLFLEQHSEIFVELERSEAGTRVQADFVDLHWISRMLLIFGDGIVAIAPSQLAEIVHEQARAGLKLYQ